MTRLNLLRLNTMPALDVALLADVSKLKSLSNAQVRELGRLPYPMLRERMHQGFFASRGMKPSPASSRRFAPQTSSLRVLRHFSRRNERGLLHGAEGGAFLRHEQRGQRREALSRTEHRCHEACHRLRGTTCSYSDWYGTDLVIFFRRQSGQRSTGRHQVSA